DRLTPRRQRHPAGPVRPCGTGTGIDGQHPGGQPRRWPAPRRQPVDTSHDEGTRPMAATSTLDRQPAATRRRGRVHQLDRAAPAAIVELDYAAASAGLDTEAARVGGYPPGVWSASVGIATPTV